MKLSKSFLLGTVLSLAMLPLSLSAVTFNELLDKIRTKRACPAPKFIEQEPALKKIVKHS